MTEFTATPLSQLTPVPLRDAWPNEAFNFTPWLHEPENLAALAHALGFEQLEPSGREIAVGPFSADILAEDIGGGKVLIENQLEQSDHDHLGKCLTYAAGLDAKTVIWICAKVRDEHLAAVNLLNDISDEEFSFFAVELELYKIGDSPLAPQFKVVAKPNHWSRSVKRQAHASDGELNESQRAYRAYWTKLIERAEEEYPAFSRGAPAKGSWQTAQSVAVDPSLSLYVAAALPRGKVRAELYFSGKAAKKALAFTREIVAQEEWFPDEELTWDALSMARDSRLALYYPFERIAGEAGEVAERDWLLPRMKKLASLMLSIARMLKDDPAPISMLDDEDGN